jgi:hypothetical protein
VGPSNFAVSPAPTPSTVFQDEYYTNRGIKVADKEWTVRGRGMPSRARAAERPSRRLGAPPCPQGGLPPPRPSTLFTPSPPLGTPCTSPPPPPPSPAPVQEWSDLPAPYKYLHVKVNPKDVEDAGFLWKAMYDWKLAVPMALLVAMPLWMTGNLPGFDERLELSLITILAGATISREVAPMFKAMKTSSLEAKNKCVGPAPASRCAAPSCRRRAQPRLTPPPPSPRAPAPPAPAAAAGRCTRRRRA